MVNGRLCETLPIEEIEQIRNESYNQALKKIKDASVIFDGEKIYGSKTKVILITEEKYNEIFNR